MTGHSWRLSEWVNSINPVNWKIALTGYMQLVVVVAFAVGWLADILEQTFIAHLVTVDFHSTELGIVFSFLAALSGVTAYGRTTERKTDYGYVERMNAGKANAAPQQVNTGDNTTLNVANAPAPAVAPVPVPVSPTGPTETPTGPDDDDAGLG
ncbi:MAG: hypothetical protein ABI119_03390 [Gemmatimonadaceae bacterium]